MAVLEKKRQQLVWFVDGTNGTPKNRCQFCKHVEQIIVLRAAQVMSQPPSGMWLARNFIVSCEKKIWSVVKWSGQSRTGRTGSSTSGSGFNLLDAPILTLLMDERPFFWDCGMPPDVYLTSMYVTARDEFYQLLLYCKPNKVGRRPENKATKLYEHMARVHMYSTS